MTVPSAKRGRTLVQVVLGILPWLFALGVIALILRRYSLSEMVGTLATRSAWLLIPLALFASVSSLFVMTLADKLLVRHSLTPLSVFRLLRGRGAISLIAAANYHAGHGSYALWLSRVTQRPLAAGASTVAYMMLCDLAAVSGLAAIALWTSGLPVAADLRWLALGLAPAVAFGVVFAAFAGPALLPWLGKRMVLLRSVEGLTRAWHTIPAGAYVQSLSVRILGLLGSILFYALAAEILGVSIPMAAFLAYMPLIYLVGALPVNVGPFGVVQVAWLHFFSRYAANEEVLALQMSFGALLSLGFVLRALPFVRGAIADMRQPNQSGTSLR